MNWQNFDQELLQKKKNLINQHGSHLSRRELLGLGLVSATGVLLSPHLFARVYAPRPSNGTSVPYLAFDLAGGPSLSGNFLVGGAGGALDLLPSYDRLGWNPRTATIERSFGLPMAPRSISKMAEGMLATMSAAAVSKFRLGSIAHVSRDDTQDNPQSIARLVASTHSDRILIGNPLGTTTATSGGSSRSLRDVASHTSVYVRDLNSILDLNSLRGPVGALPSSTLERFMRAKLGLSRRESQRILAQRDAELVGAGYEAMGKVGATFPLDPRANVNAQAVYGITPQSGPADLRVIRAGIVNAVIGGATGPGTITIGGCDYHDGTFTTGDAKDLEIGQEIGRAVELAHRYGKPLFIHLYADGSVNSVAGARDWQGDDGEKSLSIIGFYSPTGPSAYRSSSSMQIGHYLSGQGVARDTIVGSAPSQGACAAFANYLNVCGRINEFENYLPRLFSSQQLDSLLVFA